MIRFGGPDAAATLAPSAVRWFSSAPGRRYRAATSWACIGATPSCAARGPSLSAAARSSSSSAAPGSPTPPTLASEHCSPPASLVVAWNSRGTVTSIQTGARGRPCPTWPSPLTSHPAGWTAAAVAQRRGGRPRSMLSTALCPVTDSDCGGLWTATGGRRILSLPGGTKQPMPQRDDFIESVRRALAYRVANRCSNPDCHAQTSGPHTEYRFGLPRR